MLGTQSDMLKTLKVSKPHRDTLRTLKVLWTQRMCGGSKGTHRGLEGTLKVSLPQRDALGTLKCHGPVGHIGVPKDVTAPEGHIGDSKGHSGDPKGDTAPRDILGTLKVLWTHGTRWGP